MIDYSKTIAYMPAIKRKGKLNNIIQKSKMLAKGSILTLIGKSLVLYMCDSGN